MHIHERSHTAGTMCHEETAREKLLHPLLAVKNLIVEIKSPASQNSIVPLYIKKKGGIACMLIMMRCQDGTNISFFSLSLN